MRHMMSIVAGGFLAGVALASLIPFGRVDLVGIAVALVVVSLVGGGIALWRQPSGRISPRILVFLCIGAFALGMARLEVDRLGEGDLLLEELVGHEVALRGVIVDEPDVRERSTRLQVHLTAIVDGAREQSVDSHALVVMPHYPSYRYGDEIVLTGLLGRPENRVHEEGEVGRPFNYVAYLAKEGMFYEMVFPDTEHLASGKGNAIRSALFALKERLLTSMRDTVPEPHASLLGGVTVGAKASMGTALLDDFRVTGIIHIVVLSGYNITVVAEGIGRVFSFAPRYLAFGLSTAAIVGFAMMTGLGATIVRASIMAFLVLLARLLGRTSEATYALVVAGVVMVLVNPRILLFDAGFQLSFIATLGLIHLSPIIERYLWRVPDILGLRMVTAATLATQIAVLPLLLYLMGEVSLVALPVNILILALVPLTMALGFLIGGLGMVATSLSLPFAYLAYLILAYDLAVVELFSRVPFASVTVTSFPFVAMMASYIILIVVYRRTLLLDRMPSRG